jgi:hypothetical protein
VYQHARIAASRRQEGPILEVILVQLACSKAAVNQ